MRGGARRVALQEIKLDVDTAREEAHNTLDSTRSDIRTLLANVNVLARTVMLIKAGLASTVSKCQSRVVASINEQAVATNQRVATVCRALQTPGGTVTMGQEASELTLAALREPLDTALVMLDAQVMALKQGIQSEQYTAALVELEEAISSFRDTLKEPDENTAAALMQDPAMPTPNPEHQLLLSSMRNEEEDELESLQRRVNELTFGRSLRAGRESERGPHRKRLWNPHCL